MGIKNEANFNWVHQGYNLCRWRQEHGVELEAFAKQLGVKAEDVLQMEMNRTIPAEMLEKIITVFNIPRECITERVEPLPTTMITTTNLTFTNNGTVNGINECSGSDWTNTTFTNSPAIHSFDKVCELFERLLLEKDHRLQDLERRLSDLEKK